LWENVHNGAGRGKEQGESAIVLIGKFLPDEGIRVGQAIPVIPVIT
jgi:hypothetical protein